MILKKFENYLKEETEIWKVPTKMPDFLIALKKIGAENSGLSSLSFMDIYQLVHYIHHFDGGKNTPDNWTISGDGATNFDGKRFTDSKFYKGEVKITQQDIEKWKIEKNMKKYNL
ncbi:hypothetical protein K9M42_03145 [Patescibacteria group bacterium]|nr:hypothetical protein [Patescibacteria group bacterium]